MIQTIRVRTTVGPDLAGNGVLHDIKHLLNNSRIKKVETAKVYRLEGIDEKQARLLAEKLLCEEINQTYTLNKPILSQFHLGGVVKRHLRGDRTGSSEVSPIIIEIAYKPGVMNPEAASIMKAASDLGVQLVAADSSREYGFYGDVVEKDIETIVRKLNLLNETIEHVVEKEPKTLLIKGNVGKTQTIPIRKMSDKKLMELSKDKLFLNLEEMKVIQNYFRKIDRDPTDCELETIAQTWSEHSRHKTFKAKLIVDGKEKKPLIKRIKEEALKHKKHIVSAFVDNAGVMDFYDGWAISGKGETHNAPSAIEPYGGAMTAAGGVFRDILGTGQGAKIIASTDIFCFANPNYPTEQLPKGTLPPRYLLKRVVMGIRDYGNRVGIPTNNGSIHFHDDFRARPTVFAGAYGILPKKYAKKGKPRIGDLIVVVGGATGRDGIHGATFSSGEMTHETINVNVSAVQIGNAIEEKRTIDAILEARDENLINALQDCGGGGFSSAIGEIGEETGVTVHLEKAPRKYQGLSPWEIWLSESQERMIVVTKAPNLDRLFAICKKYNVEATVIGEFDGSKKLNVYYGKEKVCDLSMEFLHHGLPQRVLKATHPRGAYSVTSGVTGGLPRGGPKNDKEWILILEKVLSHGNVCSKEPIVRMYDHTVQGTNSLLPFTGVGQDGPNDAVVLRPILNKEYGVVISHGLNPVLNTIDPYWGSIWAATEAIANYVSVGGKYQDASLINNYIWPFPDTESLWSLDQSVDAVVDFIKTLKIPVISGKDSLSSTYRGEGTVIKIPPVLIMSVFGKIPDVTKTVSSDFKKVGSTIVLVGKQDIEGMGGSTYSDVLETPRMVTKASDFGLLQGGRIPHVDLKLLPRILDSIYTAIQKGKILSCHDVSEGGLITALFEMSLGGGMGAKIDITSDGDRLERSVGHGSSEVDVRSDYFLFNETAGVFVVEVENEKIANQLFKNIPYAVLGKTKRNQTISVEKLFEVNVEQLAKAWKKPMEEIFG